MHNLNVPARIFLLCVVFVMAITLVVRSPAQSVRTIAVKGFVGRPQVKNEWCWAACIQSLFLSKGLRIEQSDIVKAAYGQIVNKTAPGFEGTLALLNRVIVDVEGERWRIYAYARPTSPDPGWLFDELANNEAIMVWFRIPRADHAIVLNGGMYFVDGRGKFASWKTVTGYDPLFNRTLPIVAANIRRYVYGTFYIRIQKLVD